MYHVQHHISCTFTLYFSLQGSVDNRLNRNDICDLFPQHPLLQMLRVREVQLAIPSAREHVATERSFSLMTVMQVGLQVVYIGANWTEMCVE